MAKSEREEVRDRVASLLEQGFFSQQRDPQIKVGTPVAIMHPEGGGQHSWFVPLEVGPKLVGFAQILPTLQPLRFSSFLRSPGNYQECPDAADWTNSERVLARAAGIKKQDEQLYDPVLTYDQAPTRLAWRVTARSPSGAARSLYVAGAAVYEATRSRGWG